MLAQLLVTLWSKQKLGGFRRMYVGIAAGAGKLTAASHLSRQTGAREEAVFSSRSIVDQD